MAYSRRAGPLRSIREWGTVGAGGDDSLLVAQACIDMRGTGAAIHVLSDVGNAWDKPTPGWTQATRGADGALTFAFGGTVQAALLPNGTLRTAGAVVASTTP